MTQTDLIQKANSLRYFGIVANWDTVKKSVPLLEHAEKFLNWEDDERNRRKILLFQKKSGVKTIEAMAHFEWEWPKMIDRVQIEEIFSLHFIKEHTNIIILGPNGVGKTMIAKNLIDAAVKQGNSSLFVDSSKMLDDLVSQTKIMSLERAMAKYIKPTLLAIDELGYLAYNSQHADLLFQIIHRRSPLKSTIITTNKPFAEWPNVFPNAASVTALVDRIIENCELVEIKGDSFRARRSAERILSAKARREKKK
jgi:DNA replication protein DnaC